MGPHPQGSDSKPRPQPLWKNPFGVKGAGVTSAPTLATRMPICVGAAESTGAHLIADRSL
eukprot:352103-Chlamydomonas_euryale.AAC.1